MSIESIFRPLEKLLALHQSLYELSLQKTTLIKEGLIDELQQILVKERKIAQSVESTEKIRHKAVIEWMESQETRKDGTITELLNLVSSKNDRDKLAHLSTHLTEEITKLKHNEQLNQALLEQSLQFVKVSLDLMNPSLKNMNYGKQSESYSNKRSMFDSKA